MHDNFIFASVKRISICITFLIYVHHKHTKTDIRPQDVDKKRSFQKCESANEIRNPKEATALIVCRVILPSYTILYRTWFRSMTRIMKRDISQIKKHKAHSLQLLVPSA